MGIYYQAYSTPRDQAKEKDGFLYLSRPETLTVEMTACFRSFWSTERRRVEDNELGTFIHVLDGYTQKVRQADMSHSGKLRSLSGKELDAIRSYTKWMREVLRFPVWLSRYKADDVILKCDTGRYSGNRWVQEIELKKFSELVETSDQLKYVHVLRLHYEPAMPASWLFNVLCTMRYASAEFLGNGQKGPESNDWPEGKAEEVILNGFKRDLCYPMHTPFSGVITNEWSKPKIQHSEKYAKRFLKYIEDLYTLFNTYQWPCHNTPTNELYASQSGYLSTDHWFSYYKGDKEEVKLNGSYADLMKPIDKKEVKGRFVDDDDLEDDFADDDQFDDIDDEVDE